MTKLNITSKMILWALFPIICFAIAIAATKWYCDAAKEDIPSELKQNNTPLNWQNISFENLPAELKTQINPNRDLAYRIADASYSFPNLKNEIAKNNPNFKIYSYLVYEVDDDSRELESQWIYYNNNGMWILENIPYNPRPDFEATAIQIAWFLSFGICLIAFIVLCIYYGFDSHLNLRVDTILIPLILIPLILTGLPFAMWIILDVSCPDLFSKGNYPEWISVALILCEIAVMALIYGIYSPKLKQLLGYKDRPDKNIFGRYYQNDIPDKNNRMEIIINENFIFIKENNKWDKYTYENSVVNDNKPIFFINKNNEYKSIVAYDYILDSENDNSKNDKLTFNGFSFSRTIVKNEPKDKDSEKSWIKTYLKIEIVEELHKPNIIKRIFTKRSCLEKKEQIEKLYDECFDSIYESELAEGLERYNASISCQYYSESNIPQEFVNEIKEVIIYYIKKELKKGSK